MGAGAQGAAGPGGSAESRIIYFDFDKSDIKPEFAAIVTANAQYLTAHPDAKLKLEGNTDERGTREYNIGLGERRAQAVRRALMLQGVVRESAHHRELRRRAARRSRATTRRLGPRIGEWNSSTGRDEDARHRHVAAACAVALALAGCATSPEEDPVQIKLNDLETRLARIERVVSNNSLLEISNQMGNLRRICGRCTTTSTCSITRSTPAASNSAICTRISISG